MYYPENCQIKDISKDFHLVQNSQDVKACLESIGRMDLLLNIGCLFVQAIDGDIVHVYYSEGFVPYLTNKAYLIHS